MYMYICIQLCRDLGIDNTNWVGSRIRVLVSSNIFVCILVHTSSKHQVYVHILVILVYIYWSYWCALAVDI